MPRVENPNIGTSLMDLREMIREIIGDVPFEMVIHCYALQQGPAEITFTVRINGFGGVTGVYEEKGQLIEELYKSVIARLKQHK